MGNSQTWTLGAGQRDLRMPISADAASPGSLQKKDTQDPSGTIGVENQGLSSQVEWQLACRVAASKGLSKSELLPRFLLFVCEQQLLGKGREITEHRIGVQIFNRPADYNPGEDNIVRSYARTLRKRLDAYFENEGAKEALRISIPSGGYVPTFEPVALSASPMVGAPKIETGLTAPVSNQDQGTRATPRPTAARGSARRAGLAALGGLLAGVLLASAAGLALRAIQTHRQSSPAHRLWTQLFQENRSTLIVPGDSGLGILQNLSRHLVGVEEYANGSYVTQIHPPQGMDIGNFNDLSRQRYTSVVDLSIASALSGLPEFIANRVQVRYARSLTAEDFKSSNVILLGSKHTNPWVSLYDGRLNFRLEYTPVVDDSYVLNTHPGAGEQQVYRNGADSLPHSTYGVIAYLPSAGGSGNVLIVEGLNMAATQAAADTLFSSGAIRSTLAKATLPNGSLKPFELLVETTSIGAAAPDSRIVSTRIDSL